MATLQQICLIIPEGIQKRIKSGELVQMGGVVRDLDGKIVTFLEEGVKKINEIASEKALVKSAENINAGEKVVEKVAKKSTEKSVSLFENFLKKTSPIREKILELINKYKWALIILGFATLITIIITYISKKKSKEELDNEIKNKTKNKIINTVKSYNKALIHYLNCAKKGMIEIKTVDLLLQKIKKLDAYGVCDIIIKNSPHWQEMCTSLKDYVINLSKANKSEDLLIDKTSKQNDYKSIKNADVKYDNIYDLSKYIETHKKILERSKSKQKKIINIGG